MGKKMRMTLPKKEEDLNKVVEEVEKVSGHAHGHGHEHVAGIEDMLQTVDVLMDVTNSRLMDLEEKVEILHREVVTLYRVLEALVDAIEEGSEEARQAALRKAKEVLASQPV